MKILMKLEVAKKQNYIFSSNKLADNISNSNNIVEVTSSDYFDDCFNKIESCTYSAEENLVYSGGGHTVLQFESQEQAINFAKIVTKATMEKFDGLELFCSQIIYDVSKTPSENLNELSQKLERKKSFRKNLFEETGIGVESINKTTMKPLQINQQNPKESDFKNFEGFKFPKDFKEVACEEGFISVIHIDGNAMGKRIEKIYDEYGDNFDGLRESLNNFSKCIQSDFEKAFLNTVEKLEIDEETKTFPIRPVILAGDDVCFVTKGSIGIDVATTFLKELSGITNEFDKTNYSACAGVAIVHTKFPFYKAYQLSEELCDNAKKFSSQYDKDRGISAIDWHIEYGQLKEHLSEIRADYICEDNSCLTLKPLAVVNPKNITIPRFFEYDYFTRFCLILQSNKYNIARGKVKEMRQPLKQGELETDYYLKTASLDKFKYYLHSSEDGEKDSQMQIDNGHIDGEIFQTINNQKYCLCYDVIEIMDTFVKIEQE